MLNHGNVFSLTEYPLFTRANYVLSLQPSYKDLYNAYRQNIKRNIKKAMKYGCVIQKEIPIASVIVLANEQNNSHEADLLRFEKLFKYLHQQKKSH